MNTQDFKPVLQETLGEVIQNFDEITESRKESSKQQGEKFPVNSKEYNDPVNPSEKFAAIMVCSDADESCPFVSGAEDRVSISYDDPKAFNDNEKESAEYDKTSLLIATEMAYVMYLVDREL